MLCGTGAMKDGILGYLIEGAFFPFLRLMGPPCRNSSPSGDWKVHARCEG